MFYEKKKKIYSEVSDTNKNINCDYYNLFQNEFKKMFSDNDNQANNIQINDNQANNIQTDNNKINNIKLNNDDIVFINLFSKYIKNKY